MKKMNSILCPQNYLTTEDYNYILDHYKSGKSDYVSYKLGRQYKIMLDATDEEETEYKEVQYTPNLKRPISIIDPETTEEIKPVLYFDDATNEVKGKCKLKPNKTYFAFEIRDITDEGFKLVGGTPTFTE